MTKPTIVLIFLIVSLLFIPNCYAKNRYVNTASVGGGDGTTNATSGANAAYASLSAWQAAEHGITLTEPMIVYCEGSDADTTAVDIADWTGNSATNTITITTTQANRHNGVWNEGKYHLSGPTVTVLTISEPYTKIIGLQVHAGNSTWDIGINIDATNCEVSYCIVKSGGADNCTGIFSTSENTKVWNCIVYGFTGAGSEGYVLSHVATIDNIAYNCTAFGNNIGFRSASGDGEYYNCVSANNTDDFSASSCIIDYCASDDGDGDNPVNISPGATEATDWANAFMDYTNDDFRIKAGSVLKDAGVSDPGSGLFTDDIQGQGRNWGAAGGSWDIGADEVIKVGTVIKGNVVIGGDVTIGAY